MTATLLVVAPSRQLPAAATQARWSAARRPGAGGRMESRWNSEASMGSGTAMHRAAQHRPRGHLARRGAGPAPLGQGAAAGVGREGGEGESHHSLEQDQPQDLVEEGLEFL